MNLNEHTIQDHQIREFLDDDEHGQTARIALGRRGGYKHGLTEVGAKRLIAVAYNARHPADLGDRCPCGKFHYACEGCGADCTAGAPDGPAETDTRGVTRCRECDRLWKRRTYALHAWTGDEARVIELALTRLAGDLVTLAGKTPPEATDEDRQIAVEILSRTEGA